MLQNCQPHTPSPSNSWLQKVWHRTLLYHIWCCCQCQVSHPQKCYPSLSYPDSDIVLHAYISSRLMSWGLIAFIIGCLLFLQWYLMFVPISALSTGIPFVGLQNSLLFHTSVTLHLQISTIFTWTGWYRIQNIETAKNICSHGLWQTHSKGDSIKPMVIRPTSSKT